MGQQRQKQALAWACNTFTPAVALNLKERSSRFIEEAIELAQAAGLGKAAVLAIVDRVYTRKPGGVHREVGQAVMTLEALAELFSIDADVEADKELKRVQSIPLQEWHRRQAAKAALGIAMVVKHES